LVFYHIPGDGDEATRNAAEGCEMLKIFLCFFVRKKIAAMKHPPFVDVAPIGKGGFPVPCSLFSNLDFALLKHPFKRLDLKKVERI